MPKFRKKPIVIEAEQFLGNHTPIEGISWIYTCSNPYCAAMYPTELSESCPKCSAQGKNWSISPLPYIHTLEGCMRVSVGDYVITGVKGEKYPCKPEIFEATYEPAEREDDERTS